MGVRGRRILFLIKYYRNLQGEARKIPYEHYEHRRPTHDCQNKASGSERRTSRDREHEAHDQPENTAVEK